ncbi:MAG: response regulator [Gemmatimonadetes bacterium]|nr:response regulator [Gemmatimonadota bacterium]
MKRKHTVLLADDDKVQTMMLSTQLRAKGYSVAAAYDATYTVMVTMKSPPDVIVLDIQMPGGTGKAALERIKSSSKTTQIPVIVLSGFTDRKTIEECMALGASEYLTKPADVDKLDAAIRRVLGLPAAEQPPESANAESPAAAKPPVNELPPRDTWDH